MEVQNGNHYETNYQRGVAAFLGSFATYNEGTQVQKKAYEYVKNMYQVFGNQAEDLGYKVVGDVSFDHWEKQKGREKDVKAIRDVIKKVDAWMEEMFLFVEKDFDDQTDPKFPSRKLKKLLALCGEIDEETKQGLKDLAKVSREAAEKDEKRPWIYFSRGTFSTDGDWLIKAYDQVMNAGGQLERLCRELENRGYRRVIFRDGKIATLDYYKNFGKKDEPLKAAWGERDHLGIEVCYEELKLEPCGVAIRMPTYRKIMEKMDSFPDEIRHFLMAHTKTCNGCKYCIQTKKTKENLAYFDIDGEKKCPFYPGFSMKWYSLTEELVDNILKAMDQVDLTLS